MNKLTGEETAAQIKSLLDRIVDAGLAAQFCRDTEPVRIVIAVAKDARARVETQLVPVDGRDPAAGAAGYLLVCANPALGCRLETRRDYALFDAGRCVERMIGEAHRNGAEALAGSAFREPELKASFGIPSEFILISVVGIGCSSAEAGPSRSTGASGRPRDVDASGSAKESISLRADRWSRLVFEDRWARTGRSKHDDET